METHVIIQSLFCFTFIFVCVLHSVYVCQKTHSAPYPTHAQSFHPSECRFANNMSCNQSIKMSFGSRPVKGRGGLRTGELQRNEVKWRRTLKLRQLT